MSVSYYPKDLRRYSWFHKQDIITEAINEAAKEGALVARDLDSGDIVRYDTDDTVGDAVSGADVKPLGVVVYDNYDSGDVANIAIRGTFGDVFAHIQGHVDTLTLDDNGGTGGGKQVSWTLSHEPMAKNAVEMTPVVVQKTDDDWTTATTIAESKYTISTDSGTTTITFDSADDIPDEGVNNALKVTYNAKVSDTDIQRFENVISIRPVEEFKREV